MQERFAAYFEFNDRLRKEGHYLGCNRLEPANTAVTVRVRVTPPKAAKRITLATCNALIGRWLTVGARRPGANGVALFTVKPAYGRTELQASIVRRDAASGYETRTSGQVAVTATGVPPRAKKRQPHHC